MAFVAALGVSRVVVVIVSFADDVINTDTRSNTTKHRLEKAEHSIFRSAGSGDLQYGLVGDLSDGLK